MFRLLSLMLSRITQKKVTAITLVRDVGPELRPAGTAIGQLCPGWAFADENRITQFRPLVEVQRTKSTRKRTTNFGCQVSGALHLGKRMKFGGLGYRGSSGPNYCESGHRDSECLLSGVKRTLYAGPQRVRS